VEEGREWAVQCHGVTPAIPHSTRTAPVWLGSGGLVEQRRDLLAVYNRIKLQVDLQADKSPMVVKGPFFPRVVNPRYRIHGTMRDARVDLVKPRNLDLQEMKPMHLILKNINTNLIY
jgi:hypothetical protein